MQNRSDEELLKDFAELGSEAAFREIVTRHTDLVYSAAIRQVQSPDLARDVAQTVFVDLARKAKALAGKSSGSILLVGWLYRSARYTSLTLLRNEGRRRSREEKAMEEFNSTEESVDWNHIGAVLDEAMTNLGDEDRDALLLRFFKNEDFRTVGSRLGVSSDAAQKRVSRALDKLREHLGRMGITTSAAALSIVLCSNAVQSAPVGLTTTISGAAIASAAITVSTIATQTTMSWFSLKFATTIVAAAVVSATGTYLVQQGKINGLRGENQNLISQQVGLTSELDAAVAARAAKEKELKRNESERTELLRLRGEVGLLRKHSNDLAKLTAENKQLHARLSEKGSTGSGAGQSSDLQSSNGRPKETWTFAGYATPEDVVESWMWAMTKANPDAFRDCLAPGEMLEKWDKNIATKTAEQVKKEMEKAKSLMSYEIIEKQVVSDEEVVLKIGVTTGSNGKVEKPQKFKLQKIGNLWKIAGPADETSSAP